MPVKNPGYAYKTDVEVGKSRAEVERLLAREGAGQIITGTDYSNRSGFVAFTLKGRQYRLPVPGRDGTKRDPEQVERERWRCLVLIVKAKVELIRSGMTTAEAEFLANTVLPDGSLVGETLAPAIDQMYEEGRMLPLMPDYPKALPRG